MDDQPVALDPNSPSFSTDVGRLRKLELDVASLMASSATRSEVDSLRSVSVSRQEVTDDKLRSAVAENVRDERQYREASDKAEKLRPSFSMILVGVGGFFTAIGLPLSFSIWLFNAQVSAAVNPLASRLTAIEAVVLASSRQIDSNRGERQIEVGEIRAQLGNVAADLRNATSVIGQQVRELESQNRGIADGNVAEFSYLNGALSLLWPKVMGADMPHHDVPRYTVIHPAEPNASTAR